MTKRVCEYTEKGYDFSGRQVLNASTKMGFIKGNTFLTTKEVATFLHVNEKMVYSLVHEKGLPATKVTGKWLFPKALVEEWLETHITGFQGKISARSSDDGALLIAGSDDPLFQRTLSLYHSRNTGYTAFIANVGSMGGINSLKKGQCHIGICHLLQDDETDYNFEFASRELDNPPVVMNFSMREQGFLVQKGNPKKIKTVFDLAGKGVSIANRPLGTGTRLLLDYEISKSKIESKDIQGYHHEVSKHLDAGLEVISGRVDAAPGIRAVAGMLGLDFIPLRWERFDLLIDKKRFFEKGIQDFLGLFHEEVFQELAKEFEGYDVSSCGKMLFPQ